MHPSPPCVIITPSSQHEITEVRSVIFCLSSFEFIFRKLTPSIKLPIFFFVSRKISLSLFDIFIIWAISSLLRKPLS